MRVGILNLKQTYNLDISLLRVVTASLVLPLLRLMEPKVNKIITDKYGKQMSWRIEKIRDVALIADHTKKDSEVWYDMKMFVKVNEAEKSDFESFDDIEVRIDIPNMFTHDRYKNTNSDMKVTLLKYEQM